VTIANAVRLEAASSLGEIVIDVPTYEGLPKNLRLRYESEEMVVGKRNERFPARRCRVIGEAPALQRVQYSLPSMRGSVKLQQIVRLMESVQDDGEFDKLLFLIEIPLEHQPARTLPLAKRKAELLIWASSPRGCGAENLEDELQFVLQLRSGGIIESEHCVTRR